MARPGELPEVLDGFRADPSGSGLFFDFDGTLSPMVLDPATADLWPGVGPLLSAAAARYARVGIVSGRPVEFLRKRIPDDDIYLSGLYGMEWVDRGRSGEHDQAEAWRQVVADVVSAAPTGPEGMRTESKGLSLTLHYREHPEVGSEVAAWAEVQARRSGLELRSARMSVELHPPIETDKGTALLAACRNLARVAFAGDDLGDLDAFDALDALAGEGLEVVRIVARSDESAPELLERADVVVEGPAGVAELLEALVA